MADLKIELDHDIIYTTGDIVSGTVNLTVDEKVDLSSIDITFLGQSRSRNKVHSGQGYVTKLEKHILLKEVATLFPPPDIQVVSSSGSYTLTEGSYSYPFAFTFPGKDHNPDCKEEKKFLHSRGYTRKEPTDEVALAPTYYHRSSFDNYCRVDYSVIATVRNPSMFKFNTKASEDMKFYPNNNDMTFSVNHIINKKVHPYHDDCSKELKYTPEGTMKVEGFFKKLFSSDGIQLPMDLAVQYMGPQLKTSLGDTQRVLRSNAKLSNFVLLSLQTPISGGALRELAGDDNNEKGEHNSDSFKLRISSIKIKLVLRIRYFAVKHSRRTHKYTLLDKPLDNEISFTDFEPVPVNDAKQSLGKGELYKLDLDPAWWDCDIQDVGQSFITCNIKRDFELQVALGVASSEDISNEVYFKMMCPIVLQKRDKLELDEEDIKPPGYGNPPPEYGDEKNSEPMEWGV